MAKTREIEAREVPIGERMIEVKIRFWTDGIASGKGQVSPEARVGGRSGQNGAKRKSRDFPKDPPPL